MRILIYDVHASESGALAILNDLYEQLKQENNGDNQYLFAVSTPEYEETDNIKITRFPWVKKSWIHRLYFDNVTTRKIIKGFKPDKIYSLQNKGVSFFKGTQDVYLHLPFVLCDYKFSLKRDGKRLWLYQNVLSKSIFKSLRKVDKVIVQTNWMKDALIDKAHVKAENIVVEAPDISTNKMGEFINTPENCKRFFYPATAFNYKNHQIILDALVYAEKQGLKNYEVIFTIKKDENDYTKSLYDFAVKNNLNVMFNGPVPREKVFELYSKSVLLFPSHVESFGLPLLEARMSNCPILAGKTPFCKEILQGYDKVEFFDGSNACELGSLIVRIN